MFKSKYHELDQVINSSSVMHFFKISTIVVSSLQKELSSQLTVEIFSFPSKGNFVIPPFKCQCGAYNVGRTTPRLSVTVTKQVPVSIFRHEPITSSDHGEHLLNIN